MTATTMTNNMRPFPRLLSEDLLLITPAGYQALTRAFERSAPMDDDDEDGIEAGMVIHNGVAHIPIYGPLGRGLTEWDRMMGARDFEDIQDELQMADEDDDVSLIILDIDSPGGMVNGTPETADAIAAVEKPIHAYSAGMIASAAYWLASSADGIWATKSADIGSIGVYVPYYDRSAMAEGMGIKVQVFSSGKYKGAGVPGTSLTDEQQALIQERVIELAEMFYAQVRDKRGNIADEDMQGQTFHAQSALQRGLIDGIVSNKDELIRMLR